MQVPAIIHIDLPHNDIPNLKTNYSQVTNKVMHDQCVAQIRWFTMRNLY